jgi:hypothetical protein
MTWVEAALSRQYLAEERVGTASREAAYAEEAAFEATRKALGG